MKEKLHIPGYSVILPDSWKKYDQARIVVFISDDIKAVPVPQLPSNSDLPIITLDVGLGRCKKTRVNYYYREWTNGVTGESSQPAQLQNLQRLVTHWTQLPGQQQRDVVTLGDANLCAMSWNKPDYPTNLKELAEILKLFFINESFSQLVGVFTRSQTSVNGTISQSCIDHIGTNVPEKCSIPHVTSAGNSHH